MWTGGKDGSPISRLLVSPDAKEETPEPETNRSNGQKTERKETPRRKNPPKALVQGAPEAVEPDHSSGCGAGLMEPMRTKYRVERLLTRPVTETYLPT